MFSITIFWQLYVEEKLNFSVNRLSSCQKLLYEIARRPDSLAVFVAKRSHYYTLEEDDNKLS